MNIHTTQLHRALFPLTSPQREIWFDQVLHQDIPLYNIGGYVKIPGIIDSALFEEAINLLVQKHDTLRTVLTEDEDEDGVPMLAYAEKLTVTVSVRDFSIEAEAHEAAMVWMQQRFIEPFELTGQPLFRYDLVKISDDNYYWLIQYHHLIVDGYAVALLNRSMAEIYTQLTHGQAAPLESPSYVTFIDNDRAYVESASFEKQRQYWLGKYSTPPEPMLSPRYRFQYTDKLIGSGCEVLYLPRDFYDRLNDLAKRHKVSLFHLLLGALYVYFTRMAQRDDFAIGLPVLNRANAHFKKTAGLFTGVSPTLFNFGQGLSFSELLQQINKTLKANYRHQRFPVSEINRAVGLGQPRSQLFDISLSYENHDNDACFAGIDGQLIPLLHGYEETPLMIFVRDFHIHHDVKLDFVFNRAYFNTDDIKALQARFVTILDAVLKDSVSPIDSLPIMTEQEVRQLQTWNDTATDYPKDQTIIDLFEQQVAKTPEAIALVFEGQSLSYQQLNVKANQLAHYLLSVKASSESISLAPNPLIAIAVERSLEMVIGLLAILKMGGAYVPIDPEYPQARIGYMLEDSAAPMLLTQSYLQAQLSLEALGHDCVVVCLDEVNRANQSIENPRIKSQVEDLAYVIYTSGSTGKPKGVMIEHKGLTNLALAQISAFRIFSSSRILQFASFSFDASVSEISTTLLAGATLYLISKEKLLAQADLTGLMVQQKISHITLPPSFLSGLSSQTLSSLKTLVVAGEACPTELVKQWADKVRFMNAYGPTESTVCASVALCFAEMRSLPIGRPIVNTRIHILDKNNQLQPPGIVGELCIAGAGLARGYLNRPELTAEKFIEVALFGKTERIYKTGDLARWLPDGNIEFLGRIDKQVKLRGFRIELGEIESSLTQHETIKAAVVVLHEREGNKSLAAYLTISNNQSTNHREKKLDTEKLRSFLKEKLPDYMIPTYFTVLDALPLTPNGKINHKALPNPDILPTESFVAPSTVTELFLAKLWMTILNIEKIGIHDDFFELGGHSLNATRFISLFNEEVQEIFRVTALFEAPTIAKFVSYLEENYPKTLVRIDGNYQVDLKGKALSPLDETKFESFRKLLNTQYKFSVIPKTKNPPAIFVLAPPRSGTTLLRVLLGGHPDLFAPPELELLNFNTLQERNLLCSQHDTIWLEGTMRALMEAYGCDAVEAKRKMQAYEQQGLSIHEFYAALQKQISPRILVDKTPVYTLSLETLQQAEKMFENALYIHLVRHPYGMIHSFEEAHLEQVMAVHPHAHPLSSITKSDSVKMQAEFIWQHSQHNIDSFLEVIPTSRQHRVHFEQLVASPEESLADLCKFIGIPFHAEMMQLYQEKKQRMTDGLKKNSNMLGDIKFHHHQKINSNVAETWRKTYTEDFLGKITWQTAKKLGYRNTFSGIPRLPADQPLVMSYAQQRLWFLAQLAGPNSTYNMPRALALKGPLDISVLESTFISLVERHQSLRFTFPDSNGEYSLREIPAYNPLRVKDLSHLIETEQNAEVQRLVKEHASQPFDISQEPLLRLQLLVLGDNGWVLLFNMHHIISDGWSMGILIREWGEAYSAFSQGQAPNLAPLDIQYTDYAAWQRDWLQGEVLDRQIDYWTEQLQGAPQLLELPTDYPRPSVQTYCGKRLQSQLGVELTTQLKQFSQEQGCTLFMTLLAAYNVLLHRYSGQNDILVGSPIANRNRMETEPLIGCFINTLVLRTQVFDNPSFRDLLAQVRQTTLDAYSHQDYPFDLLVEELRPERTPSHSPLFQVMFVLNNTRSETLELPGLETSLLPSKNDVSAFDLTLSMQESAAGLTAVWEYATALFDEETMQRMAKHFQVLLEGIVANPRQGVAELPMLTPAERDTILLEWNDTRTDYSRELCLHHLFEAQAACTPDVPAVCFAGQALSYREVNARANRLARRLLDGGVQPDTLVGICVERSLETVVAMLGVLKAGAAYLPLDPNYPQERLSFMLQDARVTLLLTQFGLAQRFAGLIDSNLYLDNMDWEVGVADEENPAVSMQPEHMAYVIYTSGSTGKPKGVMIPHRALVSRALGLIDRYQLNGQDRVLQFAAFSFDVAAEETFPTWLAGGCVVIAPQSCTQSVPELMKLVELEQLSVLNLPAPYWHEWVTQLKNLGVPDSVRLVIAGSDKVLKSHMERWKQFVGSQVPVYCGYGPTETTITATLHTEQDTERGLSDGMFIGYPLPDTQTYILDQHLQPVPVGVPGELHIAGAGLARGYLHREDLTSEKFIVNPFYDADTRDSSRMYKTSDLARYLPDGNIEFLGRIDDQVKIRGFRIELGEIAAVLNKHASVNEVIVLAKEKQPGQHYLVAYVVPKAKASVILHPAACPVQGKAGTIADSEAQWQQELRQDLRAFISKRLPDYMVPATFMLLDALPVAPSGKVNLRALPEPEIQSERVYTAPRTASETILTGIWQDVLQVQEVGVFDNFFELGGHSLLVTRLLHRVADMFDIDLPLSSLFEYPVLEAFAEHIDHARQGLPGTVKDVDFHAEVWLDDDITPPDNNFRVAADTLESVFITGATGFIGAYLVHELLQQTSARIHCLVRAKSAEEGMQRLQQSLARHGLWNEFIRERLTPVVGDLGKPKFGLSDEQFDILAQQVDMIYHNGAWVNHVYPYSVLKAANVQGTREALRLACHRRTKPLHFISSLSVFAPEITEMYEEAELDRPELLGNGYVESKWVGDKLVSLAGERGLPVTIHRVSRVSGIMESGFTYVNDNYFRWVQTAVQLGIELDSPLGEDNLVPVDYATQAIVYLSTQRRQLGKVFHVGNPRNTLVKCRVDALFKAGYKIRLLPPKQWQSELMRQARHSPEIGLHPLLPLLVNYDFEREPGHILFDCQNTLMGLQGSGICCPAIDADRQAEHFIWLAKEGYLPLRAGNYWKASVAIGEI